MQNGDLRTRAISYALILLAVLVQVQTTLQLNGTAIRINAADIALAVSGPVILFAFYTNIPRLKEIAGTQLLVLAVIATVSLSISLFRGYEAISGLSTWAAIKYAGWYVLLFYLALGALIAIVTRPADRERFAVGFIFFQVIVVMVFLASEYASRNWLFHVGGRLTGFAGNTNAMAFYLLSGLALALAYLRHNGLSRRRRMAVSVAAGVVLAGILFTKSIAVLIALVSILLFALIVHVTTLMRLVQILALGWAFWMVPQVVSMKNPLIDNIVDKLSGIVVDAGSTEPEHHMTGRYEASVRVRVEGYREALSMWKEHPVLGEGLGVHLHRQNLAEKPENYTLQIHNTALWLLAETGLVGFLAMAGIFIVIIRKVWIRSRASPGEPDTELWFESGVLLILVGWAVMSLFHELMYQRIVWLFAGMALTAPVEPLILWKRVSAPVGDA